MIPRMRICRYGYGDGAALVGRLTNLGCCNRAGAALNSWQCEQRPGWQRRAAHRAALLRCV